MLLSHCESQTNDQLLIKKRQRQNVKNRKLDENLQNHKTDKQKNYYLFCVAIKICQIKQAMSKYSLEHFKIHRLRIYTYRLIICGT